MSPPRRTCRRWESPARTPSLVVSHLKIMRNIYYIADKWTPGEGLSTCGLVEFTGVHLPDLADSEHLGLLQRGSAGDAWVYPGAGPVLHARRQQRL